MVTERPQGICVMMMRRAIKIALVAQLVERVLGKDEVHRFDPGRGLHIKKDSGKDRLVAKGGT